MTKTRDESRTLHRRRNVKTSLYVQLVSTSNHHVLLEHPGQAARFVLGRGDDDAVPAGVRRRRYYESTKLNCPRLNKDGDNLPCSMSGKTHVHFGVCCIWHRVRIARNSGHLYDMISLATAGSASPQRRRNPSRAAASALAFTSTSGCIILASSAVDSFEAMAAARHMTA